MKMSPRQRCADSGELLGATILPQEQEVAGDSRGDIKVEVHATAVHHDQVLEPKVAHAMSHEISHSQAVSKQSPLPTLSALQLVLNCNALVISRSNF